MIQLPFQMPQQPTASSGAPLDTMRVGERPVAISGNTQQVLVGTLDFGELLGLPNPDRTVLARPTEEPVLAAHQRESISFTASEALVQTDLTGGRASPLRGTALPPDLPVPSPLGLELNAVAVSDAVGPEPERPVAERTYALAQRASLRAGVLPVDSEPVREVYRPLPKENFDSSALRVDAPAALPPHGTELSAATNRVLQASLAQDVTVEVEDTDRGGLVDRGREERVLDLAARAQERPVPDADDGSAASNDRSEEAEAASPESERVVLETELAAQPFVRQPQPEGVNNTAASFVARPDSDEGRAPVDRASHDLHRASFSRSGRPAPVQAGAIAPAAEQEKSPANLPFDPKRMVDPPSSVQPVQRVIVAKGTGAPAPGPQLSNSGAPRADRQGRPIADQPLVSESGRSTISQNASKVPSPDDASAGTRSNDNRELPKAPQAEAMPAMRATVPADLVAPVGDPQRILPTDDPKIVRRNQPITKSRTLVSRTGTEPKILVDRPSERPDVRPALELATQPSSAANSSHSGAHTFPSAAQTATMPAAVPEQPATIGSTPANQPPLIANAGQVERGAPASNVSQIHDAVEALSTARETAKAARPELSLRHQDFGTVNIRLENSGADVRAHLSARDPGFVPAVQAALADRAGALASDAGSSQSHRGSDQHTNQSGSQSGHAGSGFQGQSSDGRYGSSTGSDQASYQPYMEQKAESDEGAGSERQMASAPADGSRQRQSGLFA